MNNIVIVSRVQKAEQSAQLAKLYKQLRLEKFYKTASLPLHSELALLYTIHILNVLCLNIDTRTNTNKVCSNNIYGLVELVVYL